MAKEVTTPLNFLMVKTGSFDNLKKISCLPKNLLSHFRSFFEMNMNNLITTLRKIVRHD